ncbi:MAG: amidase family protein [Oscillospiraceae bacterium]|nr:amidase family protein [Oscillospiraceae bacterium]
MRFMACSNIMVKDEISSAGSKMLYNFKAPFGADVYDRCIGKGMEFAGLIETDEFGIDSLFEQNTDAAITAMLENRCDFVLCNDLFGKLQRQAPGHGLVYINPAYGAVSRQGLIPAVSSMDRIGVLCRNIDDGCRVISAISDGVSDFAKEIPDKATEYKDISQLKYTDIIPYVFYILASAEISGNTARYDGVKFGFRAENAQNLNEMYLKSRTEGFDRDTQLAIITGCMVLSKDNYNKLYHKAMQIRRLIAEHYTRLLDECGFLALSPSVTGKNNLERSVFCLLSSLCGFPSISMKHGDSERLFVYKG